MPDAQHCPLCPSQISQLYQPSQLKQHLIEAHNGFAESNTEISHLHSKEVGYYFIFPPTNECPVGECTGDPGAYQSKARQQHYFNHHGKRKELPQKVKTDMKDGKLLWWRSKFNKNTVGPTTSPAFSDAKLLQAAQQSIQSTSDNLLDASEENPHVEEDESYYADQLLTPGQAVGTGATTSLPTFATLQLPDYPDLDLPTQLSTFHLGVLHLHDFGQKNVIVCTQCRIVLHSIIPKTIRAHKCTSSIEGSMHSTDEHVSDDRDMQVVTETTEEPPVLDPHDRADPDPVEPSERHSAVAPQRALWKDAACYLTDHSDALSADVQGLPDRPIPLIPFFPVVQGYGCTFDDCPHGYLKRDTADKHILTHKVTLHQRESHSLRPEECAIQTLGFKGLRSAYFRVIGDPPPLHTIPVGEAMHKSLQNLQDQPQHARIDGVQFQNTFFRRFQYEIIYPKHTADYPQFVSSRLVKVSAIHKDDTDPLPQLLTISLLVYLIKALDQLGTMPELVRKHLANKDLSDRVFSSARSPSFRPLYTKEAWRSYTVTFATWIYYVLRANADNTVDPELQLSPEQATSATRLTTTLRNTLQHDNVGTLLKAVKNISPDKYFTKPPAIFSSPPLQALLPACESIQEDLHSMVMTLVEYPNRIQPDTSTMIYPLQRFLALLSWVKGGHSFRKITDLGYYMAQFIYFMRLAVFVQWSKLVGNTHYDDTFAPLRALHDKLLYEDNTTPFSALIEQKAYASVLNNTVTSAPSMTWDHAKQTIYLHSQGISLTTFRKMLRTEYQVAKHLLYTTLLFGHASHIFKPDGFYRRPSKIYEDNTNTSNNSSYFSTNLFFSKLHDILFQLITHNSQLASEFTMPFTTDDQKHRWHLPCIHKWLTDVDHFVRLLAILVYFTAGQPPRGTELLSTRYKNSMGVSRNVFSIQDDVTLVHTYTKTEGRTGIPFAVVRVLPVEMYELVEVYIAVVRPLQDKLRPLVFPEPIIPFCTYEALLFTQNGETMSTKQLSTAMEQMSQKHLGHSWALQSFRQINIGISNEHIPENIRNLKLSTTTVLAAQSSHRQAAHDANYDVQMDTTLTEVNTANHYKYRQLSHSWHEVIGFRESSGISLDVASDQINPTQYILDTLTSQMRFIAATTEEELVNKVSTRLQIVQHQNQPRPSNGIPLSTQVEPDTLKLLRSLHPKAYFRTPEQGQAVQFALTRSHIPLVVVHPTGSGKSSIFQLPVKREAENDKFTVVIVPIVSLALTTVINAQKVGINAHFINPDSVDEGEITIPGASLIVMTYNLLMENSTVKSWLTQQSLSGAFVRLVIDEAHTMITDTSFRSDLVRLYDCITQFNSVSLVFLTGTLPPKVCEAMLEMFSFHPIVYISRIPSYRVNIQYRVETLKVGKHDEAILANIQDRASQCLMSDPDARVIVYARTIPECNTLGNVLGCKPVYSTIPTLEKQKILELWMDPANHGCESRILVGTTSVALGIDHPSVALIFFYGDPYTMVDFAQQSGRAGRNGEQAAVHVYPSHNVSKNADEEWNNLLSTKGCRRAPLSRAMDGTEITCSALPNAALCDNCSSHEDSTDTIVIDPSDSWAKGLPAAKLNYRNHTLSRSVQALTQAIEFLGTGCPYCLLSGEKQHRHSAEECPSGLHRHRTTIKNMIMSHRRNNHTPGLTACIHCHMPQQRYISTAMDNHIDSLDASGGPCKQSDRMLDIIIALLANPRHQQTLQAYAMQKPLIPSLFTLTGHHPCSVTNPDQQIFPVHFFILSAVSVCEHAPTQVKALASEGWFSRWSSTHTPNDATQQQVLQSVIESHQSVPKPQHSRPGPAERHRSTPTAATATNMVFRRPDTFKHSINILNPPLRPATAPSPSINTTPVITAQTNLSRSSLLSSTLCKNLLVAAAPNASPSTQDRPLGPSSPFLPRKRGNPDIRQNTGTNPQVSTPRGPTPPPPPPPKRHRFNRSSRM